jgi:hypothetical protein
MKTKILLGVVFISGLFISRVNAQVAEITVKESFDYDIGGLGGQGAIEDGWKTAWSEQGAGIVTKVQDKNLCPGDAGKSIISDKTDAIPGSYSWISRNLDNTYPDFGKTFWFGIYVDMVAKDAPTWWGLQIALDGNEKIWLGTVNATGLFGFHTGDGIDGNSEVPDDPGTKAWLVLKAKMNNIATPDALGKDSIFLFINPNPKVEPNDTLAVAKAATSSLNDGFNQINLGADVAYTMGWDRIIFSDSYVGLGVSTGISKIAKNEDFNVYPTVTKGNLNVKYNLDSKSKVDLTVYSTSGQKLLTLANQQSAVNSQSYDVSSLSEGIYILTLSDGINAMNRKFVVRK